MRNSKSALTGLTAAFLFTILGTLTYGQDVFAEDKKEEPKVTITEKVGDVPTVVEFKWTEVKSQPVVIKDSKIVIATNWLDVTSLVETDGLTLDKLSPTYYKWSDAVDGRFYVTSDKGLKYLGTTFGADKAAYQVFESTGSPAGVQFIKMPGSTVYTSLGSYTLGATDNLTISNLPKGTVIIRIPLE